MILKLKKQSLNQSSSASEPCRISGKATLKLLPKKKMDMGGELGRGRMGLEWKRSKEEDGKGRGEEEVN